MDDTRYHHCRFTGTQFIGHGWLEFGGRRVKFYNCNFTNATFRRVELRAARFYDCIFDNTTFIKCELSGTKAEGGRLAICSPVYRHGYSRVGTVKNIPINQGFDSSGKILRRQNKLQPPPLPHRLEQDNSSSHRRIQRFGTPLHRD
ncbi:pentapeptide repeat-containing protein [Paenibacillus sp. MZ04-78.2]|uniref:pentapeptide repeat-containing protein n=1 Tax=Paenibacillus sp. MZ04-78.2 TaxID=2962034 RepID=UPI0035CA010D